MSPSNHSILNVSNLSVRYGDKEAVKRISFDTYAGELTAIIGNNGCGKTSLLKAIMNLVPHEGRCQLKNPSFPGTLSIPERPSIPESILTLETLSIKNRAELISYIPQKSGIQISITVRDVTLMGYNPHLPIWGRPDASMRARAEVAIKAVGLQGREDDDFLTLSEGQKQLCLLARTLVQDAPLLLLDEPDSALDFSNRHLLMKHIRASVSDKKSALICIHNPELALRYCDRILLMKDGELLSTLDVRTASLTEINQKLSMIYDPIYVTECADGNGAIHRVVLNPDSDTSSLACLIMASGMSKRFGTNKLLVDYNGHSLFENAIRISRYVDFGQTLTVTRHPGIVDLCRLESVPVLQHDLPNRNDMIRLGVARLLESGVPSGILFLPSDQPLISRDSIQRLCLTFLHHRDKICRLSYEGTGGSPVIFPPGFYEELLALPEKQGGGFLTKKYPEQVIHVPARDSYELCDIDTPEDLAALSRYSGF